MLTFVTKNSIIDVAGVLDPLMPKARRVEQKTNNNQPFSRAMQKSNKQHTFLLMPTLLAI